MFEPLESVFIELFTVVPNREIPFTAFFRQFNSDFRFLYGFARARRITNEIQNQQLQRQRVGQHMRGEAVRNERDQGLRVFLLMEGTDGFFHDQIELTGHLRRLFLAREFAH